MIYSVEIFFDVYKTPHVFENIDKLVLYFQESFYEDDRFSFRQQQGYTEAIVGGCSMYIIFGLTEEEYNTLLMKTPFVGRKKIEFLNRCVI